MVQQMAGVGVAPQMQQQAMGDESTPTPEEQAMYDAIVGDIEKILYSKKTMPRIIKMLGGKEDPTDAIMHVLMMLGKREKEGFEQANIQVPDEVWRAAAEELVPVVAELGASQGVFPELSQEQMHQALAKLAMAWSAQYTPDGPGMQQMMQRVPPQLVKSIQANAAKGAMQMAGGPAGANRPPMNKPPGTMP